MRKESANPPLPSMLAWIKIWGAALLKPNPDAFEAAFRSFTPHRATALAWLVTGGIVAGIINLITFTAPPEYVLVVMACVLPLNAFIYSALTIFTARGALWIADQMDRSGAFDKNAPFDRLFYALAAVNAPMSILSALAYLLPYGNYVAYALSIYWIYLTVVAIKTLVGLPWGKAVVASAVFIFASILVVVLSVGVALAPPV